MKFATAYLNGSLLFRPSVLMRATDRPSDSAIDTIAFRSLPVEMHFCTTAFIPSDLLVYAEVIKHYRCLSPASPQEQLRILMPRLFTDSVE